jgi:hypothetical protein
VVQIGVVLVSGLQSNAPKRGGEKLTRQSIELPETVKEGLDKMATDFGMTQNALINLAVTTMVVKYEAEGTRIFFDLISPPRRIK